MESPQPRRSPVRRLLRIFTILVAAVLLLAVGSGAAMFRRDIPVEDLVPRYAAPPSQFMELEGLRVHYRDEGTGPPLLLIHGTSSSLHTWDGWTARLSDRRRIVRFDLPGFGLTGPAADRDYRVERYVRVTAAFLDKLDIQRADVGGNSLGGRVAASFALEYPHRVRKLVLVDPAGLAGVAPPTIFKLAQNPVLSRLLLHLTPRFMIRRNLEQVYGDPARVTDEVVDRIHSMALRAGNRQALVDRLTGPPDPVLDDRLSELDLPVLIQWGALDAWIPPANAKRFESGIAGSRLIVYPGAGHVPMEEIPEATARDADAFLGE